jgi:hypothetical protein
MIKCQRYIDVSSHVSEEKTLKVQLTEKKQHLSFLSSNDNAEINIKGILLVKPDKSTIDNEPFETSQTAIFRGKLRVLSEIHRRNLDKMIYRSEREKRILFMRFII